MRNRNLCVILSLIPIVFFINFSPVYSNENFEGSWEKSDESAIQIRWHGEQSGPSGEGRQGDQKPERQVGSVAADPNEYITVRGCHRLPGADANGSGGLNPGVLDSTMCELRNESCAQEKGHEISTIYTRPRGSSDTWTAIEPPGCRDEVFHPPLRADKPMQRLAEAGAAGAPAANFTVEDFRRLPIKPLSFTIQPSVNTLKNYNTNFYITAVEQNLTDTIRGKKVEIRSIPVSCTYIYGDGSTLGPVNNAGKALPASSWDEKTSTSHRYRKTGKYKARIITTFTGRYRVEGGDWQNVPGTADVASPAQSLTVWRTKNGWVQDSCRTNPNSWGC